MVVLAPRPRGLWFDSDQTDWSDTAMKNIRWIIGLAGTIAGLGGVALGVVQCTESAVDCVRLQSACENSEKEGLVIRCDDLLGRVDAATEENRAKVCREGLDVVERIESGEWEDLRPPPSPF